VRLRGREGSVCREARIVATKKRRRIVKRGTRHQDGIALDVRAGIGTACTSSHSSTHSSESDFRWASATGRTWSRLNRTTHRCGSPPSVWLRVRSRRAPSSKLCWSIRRRTRPG
jgi:hypothetical protein